MKGWKRAVDVVLASAMLGLLAIPLLLLAVAIKLADRGPVLFRQERIGRGGRPFDVWKLRTMEVGAAERGLGLTVSAGDERITAVGRVLRGWGLDELPQLINVLVGTMSLVGPRPTLRYQVERYDVHQRRRLEMKPGLTSLAVVSGRNALSWPERIDLDVWYVDHWSLGLDLRILVRTVWHVLVLRDGLYGPEGVNDAFLLGQERSSTEDRSEDG